MFMRVTNSRRVRHLGCSGIALPRLIPPCRKDVRPYRKVDFPGAVPTRTELVCYLFAWFAQAVIRGLAHTSGGLRHERFTHSHHMVYKHPICVIRFLGRVAAIICMIDAIYHIEFQ